MGDPAGTARRPTLALSRFPHRECSSPQRRFLTWGSPLRPVPGEGRRRNDLNGQTRGALDTKPLPAVRRLGRLGEAERKAAVIG